MAVFFCVWYTYIETDDWTLNNIMKLVNKRALSFDDILLVPGQSDIPSRLDHRLSLKTNLTRNVEIDIPITSTNMSSVTETDMLVAMNALGSVGFLHRFSSIDDQASMVFEARERGMVRFVASVGVKDSDYTALDEIIKLNPCAILIDIAHGDSIQVLRMLRHIKRITNIDVIAGNVATSDGYKRLVDAGADGVRVGIGGGGACTTRIVTGFGVPTLQSIIDCMPAHDEYRSSGHYVPIIADGGFTKSSDIVKALAAGASSVCLGSLLASTSHSPGQVKSELYNSKFDKIPSFTLEGVTYYARATKRYGQLQPVPVKYVNNLESDKQVLLVDYLHSKGVPLYKEYYGMSSQAAQDKFKGGIKSGVSPEGIHKQLLYTGDTFKVIEQLLGGIRSGMTYNGSYDLKSLYRDSEFIILAPGAVKESKH